MAEGIVPAIILIEETETPLESPPANYLPRQFGTRGLLILVTWAAVLMGCLRALGATPTVFFLVLTFVAGVLIAQVLLFGGRRPQAASMWAGAFLLPSGLLVVGVLLLEPPFSRWIVPTLVFGSCGVLVPVGIVLGAIVGPICGMVYAVSESLLVWIFRGLPEIELQPIAEADIDVLLAWVRGPEFCQRWAGDQLTYPLDRKQLLDRFATAQGENPTRLIFKAVDVHAGNMLGYAEIRGFDRLQRRARLELPLVDPAASERGRLGVLLLQKGVEKAFGELGLMEIRVSCGSRQSELALCSKRVWAISTVFYMSWNEAGTRPSIERPRGKAGRTPRCGLEYGKTEC